VTLSADVHPSSVRNFLLSAVVGYCLLFVSCYGCGTKQDPQQLKEKTAQTTAQLKSDAKAVASGIREGWSRDKPLDINHATRDQLTSLPGISASEADRIIANRPYETTRSLVTKRLLSQREFDRVKDRITAK
jgi:DNA uptake protein ComE-like DNA-binding protein